jgi:hypothetical protein
MPFFSTLLHELLQGKYSASTPICHEWTVDRHNCDTEEFFFFFAIKLCNKITVLYCYTALKASDCHSPYHWLQALKTKLVCSS